jgi:hypothetical protein
MGGARFRLVRRLVRADGARSRPGSWPTPWSPNVVWICGAVTSGHCLRTLASACRRRRIGSGRARLPSGGRPMLLAGGAASLGPGQSKRDLTPQGRN